METVYENNPERAEVEHLRDALDYVYRKLEEITADSYTDIWKDLLLIFIESAMRSSYKRTGEER